MKNKELYENIENVDVPDIRRRIEFVFQQYSLFPHLTIIDNMNDEKIKELLEYLEAKDFDSAIAFIRKLSISESEKNEIFNAIRSNSIK